MEHDLVRRLRRVDRISFAPIVAHRVRKDAPSPIEVCGGDAATHLRIPL